MSLERTSFFLRLRLKLSERSGPLWLKELHILNHFYYSFSLSPLQRQYYTTNDNLNIWKEIKTSRINSYSFVSVQIWFLTQQGWSHVVICKAFIFTLCKAPASEGRCKSRCLMKTFQLVNLSVTSPTVSTSPSFKVPLWPPHTMLMLLLRQMISKKAIGVDSSGTAVLFQAYPVCSAGMHTY